MCIRDRFLVAHEDLRRSARIRAVFDFLVEAFAQDAAFFLNGGESVFANNTPRLSCSDANADSPAHGHVPLSRKLDVAE